MSATTDVTCSGCGSQRGLHVVIAGRSPGDDLPGRLLLYCQECRRHPGRTSPVSVSIPLNLVSLSVFLGLYRLGATESDPQTAARIVFGPAVDSQVAKAALWAIRKLKRDRQ